MPRAGDPRPLHNCFPRPLLTLVLAAFLLFGAAGCSVRKLAVNSLAKALSGADAKGRRLTDPGEANAFTSDDDPELVGDALPFALKTFETLLEEIPEHVGLLVATCQGFTLYGYAYVELEAERLELESYRAAQRQRDRALRLYLRGRGYCFRALDRVYPGVREALVREPEGALAETRGEDVALLYATALSWGAVISLGLDQPELVADVPAVRALLERCLELDPDHGRGTLHDAMIALEGLPEHMGGSRDRARRHYDRALELNGGLRAGTHVTWATSVSYRRQDRAEFERMLNRALAVDPDELESERLINRIQQERARFLLDQADDLFLEDLEDLEDLEESEDPAGGDETDQGEEP